MIWLILGILRIFRLSEILKILKVLVLKWILTQMRISELGVILMIHDRGDRPRVLLFGFLLDPLLGLLRLLWFLGLFDLGLLLLRDRFFVEARVGSGLHLVVALHEAGITEGEFIGEC